MAMEDVLRKQDLQRIYEDVLTAASKWHSLGLALRLHPDDLETIKTAKRDIPTECLKEMLNLWLSKSSQIPTRKKLIAALRQPTVGHEELADDLEKNYRSKIQPATIEAVESVAHDGRLQQTSTSQQSCSPAKKPVKRPSTSHIAPNPKRNVCESVYYM